MPTPLQVLQTTFGYHDFRPPQQDIIETVCSGGDALVLMPTGGGKSLCYQVPALVRSGCGVVISPLIALMQDQVSAMQLLGVRAAFLNSTLSWDAVREVETALQRGEVDLLYMAPERLLQERMLSLLQGAQIALFAIDEAHCVSQWGHDFRADYLQLDVLQRLFPQVPRIALTATADSRTRQEICQRLSLQNARQFVASFDRPNICYRMVVKDNPRQQLWRFLQEGQQGKAGIIYCGSRQQTEDIAQWLQEKGYNALPYHAGLDSRVRADHQARFLREEEVVMVATIAFGMGIDKPDVRFVVHLDLPKSIEAYYQETGRAGRDGEPAVALLLYGLQDVIRLRQFLSESQGSEEYKRIEQFRLNAMLGLCESSTCRRQILLRYFAEEAPQPCGNCDICLQPPALWDATEQARLALSAVFRTGQRFGVNHLVDVLRGVENDRIFQFDHHQLALYGQGKAVESKDWRSIFRQLVALGYLHVDLEGYGGLRLSEQCRPLLRGEAQLMLRRDTKVPAAKKTKGKAKPASAPPLSPADLPAVLWEALRRCRTQLAETQQVPPYVIFHNATLEEMCQRQPTSLAELADISGIGARKMELYGEAFVAVIRQFQETRQ